MTSEDTRPKAAIFFRRATRESFCNASLAQQVRVSERKRCAEKRVKRRSTMKTLIILIALTTIAIPVLTEFAAAATHLFAGASAEDGNGNGSEIWELSR